MNVTEKPIVVSLEPEYEPEYLRLLNEYFTASERNGRASSIEEKKRMMAVKESMASLCNRNPHKLDKLEEIINTAHDRREKVLVMTRSGSVASELSEELARRGESARVLLLDTSLSVHELNRMVEQFNKSPQSTALIVTDSVHTGLDLTAANHLVHYDYPPRYTDILQRNNRITRQTAYHADAYIYYLVTSGRIDEFDYRECMRASARMGAISNG